MIDGTPPSTLPLSVRTIAMPADTNPAGDIFGGWLVSQMDLAALNVGTIRAKGRVVTVAIESLTFHRPVFVGDEVSCYADIERIGRTSLAIKVEVWVRRAQSQETIKVAEGIFTFVAVDESGKPRVVPKDELNHF